ncbi:MAG: hypothetical protein A4E42_01777 [Methanoregulaceae archaeon PtaU1.Bin222]|nr:MAG: hypothetical protein A4E42_01777 [Methanoregulaceae archaeon PtaU1.Bin222]
MSGISAGFFRDTKVPEDNSNLVLDIMAGDACDEVDLVVRKPNRILRFLPVRDIDCKTPKPGQIPFCIHHL